jgi:alpha-methylacyl-CoA racemase
LRGAFVDIEGVIQPAPAPRYSETPNATPAAPRPDADELLGELGYAQERIAALRAAGTIS